MRLGLFPYCFYSLYILNVTLCFTIIVDFSAACPLCLYDMARKNSVKSCKEHEKPSFPRLLIWQWWTMVEVLFNSTKRFSSFP